MVENKGFEPFYILIANEATTPSSLVPQYLLVEVQGFEPCYIFRAREASTPSRLDPQ